MLFKSVVITWLLAAAALLANAQTSLQAGKIPQQHQQLVVVTAPDWTSQQGSLQLYQRNGSSWVPVGEKIAVVLGKNGLAWGRGLHAADLPGPQKAEGDGKATAGIFKFGEAFGYSAAAPAGSAMPYRQATARDYWVDAPSSPAYNSWVSIAPDKENNPMKYWSSFERMKRADQLYALGIVVKHNMEPVAAGKGSAIFLHIWRGAGMPTLGCTAMSKQDLTALLTWLNPEMQPLFIQAPQAALSKVINF